MKISSRSILSPGRVVSGRDPQPISLSRRLRTSRSIKGATSPAMFPAGKKRGCGFDNPEPTSPKVTCIGQVRVKNKKKNVTSLSKRRNTSGGVGFSKLEHSCSQRIDAGNNNNNQKWVHIPLTICEALRTFGSEVSCLFPCRSSTIEKEEKMGNRQGTCAVFARWLVAMNEGEDAGEKREIELVRGDDNDDNRKLRRHVFEDLEIVNDSVIDEGRVSICVPPKNALLLMRCRSDPMMLEALANRFWEPNLDQNDEDEDECVYDEIINHEIVEMNSDMESKEGFREENVEMKQSIHEEKQSIQEEKQSIHEEKQIIDGNEEEESMFIWCLFEEFEEEPLDMVDALEEFFENENFQEIETGESNVEIVDHFEDSVIGELKIEKVKDFEQGGVEDMVMDFSEGNEIEALEEIVMELEEVEDGENAVKELPECLLLMMYEPKLSMEVSKETWVCSSDFIRGHSGRKKPPPPPPPKVMSIDGQVESNINALTTKEHDNDLMRMSVVPYELGLHQPARSSCSLPTQRSMAIVLEQKPLNRTEYEPLVLKRCKSEPMRNNASNLAPETCLWGNQLEPPRRASFGVGTAGLGF